MDWPAVAKDRIGKGRGGFAVEQKSLVYMSRFKTVNCLHGNVMFVYSSVDKTLLYGSRAKPAAVGRIKGASHSEHSPKAEKADLVNKIKARLASVDPNKARELGGVFLFNIIKGTSVYSWTLDLNQVTVYEGEPDEDPDTTFTLNEHYFKQLVTGREDPRVIMQAGRCSVTGDIMRAMQLEPYIKLE